MPRNKNGNTVAYPYTQEDLKKKYIYDESNNLIYEGSAAPGTATSKPGWQIKKYVYVVNKVSEVLFAGGTNAHESVMDDYLSYDYS